MPEKDKQENGNEIALILAAKNGDKDAFSRLVNSYKNQIFSLAYRKLANKEDAYDAAQETFLRLFRSLQQYESSRKFSSWLYKITVNICIDMLRKKGRQGIPVELDEKYIPEINYSESPEERYSAREEKDRLEKIIAQLPDKYKSVLILRHLHDKSYQDMAEIENISLTAVKSRLFRAREIVRERLEIERSKEGDKYELPPSRKAVTRISRP